MSEREVVFHVPLLAYGHKCNRLSEKRRHPQIPANQYTKTDKRAILLDIGMIVKGLEAFFLKKISMSVSNVSFFLKIRQLSCLLYDSLHNITRKDHLDSLPAHVQHC